MSIARNQQKAGVRPEGPTLSFLFAAVAASLTAFSVDTDCMNIAGAVSVVTSVSFKANGRTTLAKVHSSGLSLAILSFSLLLSSIWVLMILVILSALYSKSCGGTGAF